MKPIISVITPVFNGESFIEACIDNVSSQNCTAIEHIIVDGGSSDRTPQIVKRISETNGILRFIPGPDCGQSDALNKGIKSALASYIGILNVDDFYEPGVLSKAVDLITKFDDERFIVANCRMIDRDKRQIQINQPRCLEIDRLLIGPDCYQLPWNPSAYFYPKRLHDLVGPYDIDEHYAMDVGFLLRALQKTSVTYIDEIWGNMRYFSGTKTFEDQRLGTQNERVKRIYREVFVERPLSSKVKIIGRRALYRSITAVRRFRRSGPGPIGLHGGAGG